MLSQEVSTEGIAWPIQGKDKTSKITYIRKVAPDGLIQPSINLYYSQRDDIENPDLQPFPGQPISQAEIDLARHNALMQNTMSKRKEQKRTKRLLEWHNAHLKREERKQIQRELKRKNAERQRKKQERIQHAKEREIDLKHREELNVFRER